MAALWAKREKHHHQHCNINRIRAPALVALVLVLNFASGFIPPSKPSRLVGRVVSRSMSSAPIKAANGDGESLLSPLLGQVATSKTIEIHALTKAMEAKGEAVVSLCVGEPDFPPPTGKEEVNGERRRVDPERSKECLIISALLPLQR